MSKRRRLAYLAIVLAAAVSVAWIIWGNTALELNTYTIESNFLPKAFDGYRIAHVSDLHNAEMGDDNIKLLAMLQEAEPDIIAVTGDLIDSGNTDIEVALQFAEDAVRIAPVYYVTGNHEVKISAYDKLQEGLRERGVVVLEDERMEIMQSGEKIALLGVNDPSFRQVYSFDDSPAVMQKRLKELVHEKDTYRILLSHRPELYEVYVEAGIDLVLSGHAHGGQFRLPWVGGLVAPNQGLFPKYDAGLFAEERTNMLVSRGIGNSIIPIRFCNRPEVILVELRNGS